MIFVRAERSWSRSASVRVAVARCSSAARAARTGSRRPGARGQVEKRRAEQLERRLRVDEQGEQVRERREEDRAADEHSEEERARRLR